MKFLKWFIIVVVAVLVAGYLSLLRFDIPAAEIEAKYTNEHSSFLLLDNGLRVHYRDQGNMDGPVVVLLHGSNASLHTWEPWVQELNDDFRLVSLDLQGHGLTGPSPTNAYTILDMVDTVHSVKTALGIDHFSLVGSSMGGRTAWHYAIIHPEGLDALVLVAASGYAEQYDENDEGPLAFRLLSTSIGRELLSNLDPSYLVEEGLKASVYDPAIVTQAMIDQYTDLALRDGNREATGIRFTLKRSAEYVPRIPEIVAPTLILQGAEDNLVPGSIAEHFNADIAGSKLIVYDQVGHLPMEEIPVRSANDVREFVNSANRRIDDLRDEAEEVMMP